MGRSRQWRHALIRIAFLASVVALSCHALAQPQQSSAQAKANEHVQRARDLVNENKDPEALMELREAYRLVPDPTVLCQMGVLQSLLHEPIEALSTLEACLLSGAPILGTLRNRAAERADAMRKDVGTVLITTNVKDAVIKLDGVDVDAASIGKPMRVLRGRHEVKAEAAGGIGVSRVVEVGGDLAETKVELTLTRATEEPATPPPAPLVGTVNIKMSEPKDERLEKAEELRVARRNGTVALIAGSTLVVAGAVGTRLTYESWKGYCGTSNYIDGETGQCSTYYTPLFGGSIMAMMLGGTAVWLSIYWLSMDDDADRSSQVGFAPMLSDRAWGVSAVGTF